MAEYIEYAKIPMQKNDIGAKTLGEYFENLLLTLWDEQEDFSGKRPFGNSGWEYDVYAALISAGVVDGSLDEEGYVTEVTYSAANDIIAEMIKAIFAKPTADVAPRAEVDKQIAKQKAMVLDVIDTFRNLLCIESYLDYEDTRPHYCVSIDDVNRIHAELKKKYTEAEQPEGD